jgi:hypothetical protein
MRSLGSLICVLVLLQGSVAAQQPGKGSWDAITQLRRQEKVEVYPVKGKRTRGVFRSATNDSVTVSRDSRDITFAKSDVREVKVRRTSGRFRNAGIGAAVGGGIVGGIIAIAIRGDFDDGMALAIFTVFTSVAALTGFAIGVAFPGYNTIYKVP